MDQQFPYLKLIRNQQISFFVPLWIQGLESHSRYIRQPVTQIRRSISNYDRTPYGTQIIPNARKIWL